MKASTKTKPVKSAATARPRRRRITHVAIRFQGKIWSLPEPFRHHHIFRIICYLDSNVDRVDSHGTDQGFLEASGKYLTRDQALVVVKANGQLKGGRIIGGVLTSEDLW